MSEPNQATHVFSEPGQRVARSPRRRGAGEDEPEGAPSPFPQPEAGAIETDDRRRIEREELRHEKAADDGDAHGAAQLRARAVADGERQSAEERRHGRHHDGPEAKKAGFVNRLKRRLAVPLRFEREIDHHDRILLHDAD